MNHADHRLIPPGIEVLNTVQMKPGLKVLDIGLDSGNQVLELAQRLGRTSSVYGLAQDNEAVSSIIRECDSLHLDNVEVFNGELDKLPFADAYFDLIISNNGFRDAGRIDLELLEVCRVSKPSSQFIITTLLHDAMKELYTVILDVLGSLSMPNEAECIKSQIHSRQKPLKEVEATLKKAGFSIRGIKLDQFSMSFLDGTALLNHYIIRNDVLDIWRDRLEESEAQQTVLHRIEQLINERSSMTGVYVVNIPYAVLNCSKKVNSHEVFI